MGCIFVVMPKEEDAERIASSLSRGQPAEGVFVLKSGAEVLERAGDWESGIVITTRRLRDMAYSELLEYLPEYFSVTVITGDGNFDPISRRVTVLRMPFRRNDLLETVEAQLKVQASSRKRLRGPRKRSSAEQQLVDEAKALLMEKDGMSEPEAFRYIQKNSMDSGRSMTESAQMIIYMKAAK